MAAPLRNPELFSSVAEILDPGALKDPVGTKYISGSDAEGNRVSITARQVTGAVQLWEIGIRDRKGELKGSVDLVLGDILRNSGTIKRTNGIIEIEDSKGDRFVIGSKLAAAIYHNPSKP